MSFSYAKFKFGFSGLFEITIVGADVPGGPFAARKDSLSDKGFLRGAEDVAPYIGFL